MTMIFTTIFHSDEATSATAPDAPARPTALPAGGMLINQHDTSWRNDLRTRVDEVGNFLIYILHGANMHNLVVQVETAFDVPRLQRRNVSIRSRSTRADGRIHNGIFVLFPYVKIFAAQQRDWESAELNDYYF